ncbi:hypothetical protein VZT92_005872 [Zoarces viviparus]|uniref:Uncharacterized protein n=1 Tax=Zoarces viviparus TaxID=48416 RepID=A0AAW1FPG8_ZOAVI
MQGPIQGGRRGPKGGRNGDENEQIQRQRKESKGTSEVRRHCVHTTIQAAPTLSTGLASPKILLPPRAIHTAQRQRGSSSPPPAGGLLLQEGCRRRSAAAGGGLLLQEEGCCCWFTQCGFMRKERTALLKSNVTTRISLL